MKIMNKSIITVFAAALLSVISCSESEKEQRIKKEINNTLEWDSRVFSENVKVKVDDSEVTLTGVVESFAARNAAESAAWLTQGVTDVDNLLTVEIDVVELPVTLQERVRATLVSHSGVNTRDIVVKADNNKVELEGSVPNYWQRILAEDLAADTVGVKTVENELAIVPEEDLSDELIAASITSALEREDIIDPDKITVDVNEGRVELSGAVDSQDVREAAYAAAAKTLGVTEIENDILILQS